MTTPKAVCRKCGAGDGFASVESILGTCAGEVTVNRFGELEFEPGGYTRVAWDTSETREYACLACGAEARTLTELAEVKR